VADLFSLAMTPPEKDPSDGGSGGAQVAPAEKPQTRKYAPEELLADSRALTGYPTHVLAGALHADEREKLTADNARKLCEDWLEKPAETDEPAEDEE
jgi:hypothetical protein